MRSKRFDVRRMKSRKARLMRPCTASASARSRRGNDRRKSPPARRRSPGRGTTAASSPRGSPDARDLVDRRHGAVRILRHIEDREVRRQMRVDQRREGERDEGELNAARRCDRPPSIPHRRCARPRTGRRSAPALRRARGRRRNGRFRRSLHRRRLPFLPTALFLERLDDLSGHVPFVVFGEDLIAAQPAVAGDNAFDDDALAFAKEVWHVGEAGARAIDANGLRSVRDIELEPVVGPRDGARSTSRRSGASFPAAGSFRRISVGVRNSERLSFSSRIARARPRSRSRQARRQ